MPIFGQPQGRDSGAFVGRDANGFLANGSPALAKVGD
jgi:hypothetical protein